MELINFGLENSIVFIIEKFMLDVLIVENVILLISRIYRSVFLMIDFFIMIWNVIIIEIIVSK